jgi:peptidoglycan/LPS O-acetylase OafA/YrhL
MLMQQKNLQLIQMLRGVASMLVVLLHITVNFSDALGKPFLFDIFKFGGSGVDIFFVLSGFIITYSNVNILSKPNAVTSFLKRRFIRIFPIYWITITFFLIIQVVFFSFYKTHFVFSVGNVLQTYLLLPEHIMVNGVSWSLTNELFFYLLFTLAIIIAKRRIVIIMACIYFLVLLYLGVSGYGDGVENNYFKLLLFPMNIEFLMGAAIVLLVKKVPVSWVYPLLISGIALFVFGAVCTNRSLSFFSNGMGRVLFFGMPSFLIILSLVKFELYKNVQLKSIFLQLGDASYSIYLVHLPLVAAFYRILAKMQLNNSVVLYILSIGLFAGVCILGIVVYNKVEKPLIKKLNKALL